MKKFARIISALIITTACAFCLLTCDNLINFLDLNKSESGKGTFRLVIGNESSARTILPTTATDSDIAVYTLAFTGISTNIGNDTSEDITALTQSVTLTAGDYDLVVTAYKDSGKTNPVAKGSVDGITITANTTTNTHVTLKPIDTAGTGTFSWDITPIPTGATVKMTITPESTGGTVAQTIPSLTATGSTPLNSGEYTVVLELTKASKTFFWEEYLYIYQNLTSTFTKAFNPDHLKIYLASITLNKTSTSIVEGGTETLSVTSRLPTDATDDTYTWKTSDAAKATVSTSGVVTAVEATVVGTPVIIYAEANDGSGVKGECAVTVTAPSTYTVTFDKNGGTTEASPTTKTVISPATTIDALPTAPTRTGWTFVEWNTENDNTGTAFTASTTVSANITVYAIWKATVTFNNNYGASPTTQTVDVITPATTVGASMPTDPTRTDWTFVEWNTAADGSGTTPFTATTTVTGNTTVYAKWAGTGATITVEFEELEEEDLAIPDFTLYRNTGSKTKTVSLTNPSQYSSITWMVNDDIVEGPGTVSSLTLDEADYTTLGARTLTIIVVKAGKTYTNNVVFTVAYAP